jgi:tetratricopeptide (TPR) repeat protein
LAKASATAIDSAYAPPYAALAEAFAKLYYFETASPAETADPARTAATRALQLDDHLARAHEAAALIRLIDWDPAGAEREFRRAIELDATDTRIRYAYAQQCLNPAGRHQEAIEQLRVALNFDPVARYLITELGATYLMAGQYALAREQFQRSLEFNPRAAGTLTNLAAVAEGEGNFAEAVASLEKVNAETPGDPWIEGHLGYAYAKAGQIAAARRVLSSLTAAKGIPALHIAAVYAGLGDADRALAYLDRGVTAHSPSVYWLATDFRFASLRSSARYAKLATRLP